MVDAWMPGARCLRAQTDGGTLRGGAPRVVWQALGADPRLISATSAAERLVQQGRPPHLVWNPLSGDIVQLIPVVRAACSLGAPEGLDCWTSTAKAAPANRQGRLCAQVGVLAWAWEPFTDGPMHRAAALLNWLASWGVPSRWPAGRPGRVHARPDGGAQLRAVGARRALRRVAGTGLGRGRPGGHRHRPAECAGHSAVRAHQRITLVPACQAVYVGRPEALTNTLRMTLTDMLGPEMDDDRAPAPGRLARQRALSSPAGPVPAPLPNRAGTAVIGFDSAGFDSAGFDSAGLTALVLTGGGEIGPD